MPSFGSEEHPRLPHTTDPRLAVLVGDIGFIVKGTGERTELAYLNNDTEPARMSRDHGRPCKPADALG